MIGLLAKIPVSAYVIAGVAVWGGLGRMQLAAERAAHADSRAKFATAAADAAIAVSEAQAEAVRRGAEAARTLEEERDAIRTRMRAPAPRVAVALAAPACPASAPVAVGDVVLPPGALDRVRAAAGAGDRPVAADADPGKPGAAVRPGPAHP